MVTHGQLHVRVCTCKNIARANLDWQNSSNLRGKYTHTHTKISHGSAWDNFNITFPKLHEKSIPSKRNSSIQYKRAVDLNMRSNPTHIAYKWMKTIRNVGWKHDINNTHQIPPDLDFCSSRANPLPTGSMRD